MMYDKLNNTSMLNVNIAILFPKKILNSHKYNVTPRSCRGQRNYPWGCELTQKPTHSFFGKLYHHIYTL